MSELLDRLTRQLHRDEGRLRHAYQDHLGYWTIGVGRLIDARRGGGLSEAEIDYLLHNDIRRVQQEVERNLPWSKELSPARQGVLLAMAFQMGIAGLMGFRNTLRTIESGDYQRAGDEMLMSKWATQTPARAKRLSVQMKTGEWQ